MTVEWLKWLHSDRPISSYQSVSQSVVEMPWMQSKAMLHYIVTAWRQISNPPPPNPSITWRNCCCYCSSRHTLALRLKSSNHNPRMGPPRLPKYPSTGNGCMCEHKICTYIHTYVHWRRIFWSGFYVTLIKWNPNRGQLGVASNILSAPKNWHHGTWRWCLSRVGSYPQKHF